MYDRRMLWLPIYFWCSGCRLGAVADRVLYTPTDEHEINWREQVWIMCANCGHDNLVRQDAVLAYNACSDCSECAAPFEHPGQVAVVRCTRCGGVTTPRLEPWRRQDPAALAKTLPWATPAEERDDKPDPWSDLRSRLRS
jgi:DNA-directed RNA polymerase subunit RPC12/RpoP